MKTPTSIELPRRLRFDTVHGEVLDDQRRYVLLRSDVLMGIFDELPEPLREQALRAFGRSAATHGADSVRAYAALPGVDGAALLRTMEYAAASLGWGRWRLMRSARSLTLQVDNSPFAASTAQRGGPVCHAIAGMLQGLAAAYWSTGAVASETICAAEHGGTTCHFIAGADGDGADTDAQSACSAAGEADAKPSRK